MATGIHADVIAEGVETERQAEALVRIGCRHAQGFLFGRAVAAEVFSSLVDTIEAATLHKSDVIPLNFNRASD